MDAALSLRPEQAEDEPFLRKLYATTRAAEMALTNWDVQEQGRFLDSQFDLQRTHYRRHYPDAAFDVVLLDAQPIGRLYVLHQGNEIRLMEISLVPECRGRGFGTQLITRLFEASRRSQHPVTLHVEPYNRALRLYERLGFKVVSNDGMNVFMKREPDASQP